jgi:hypothetical protein
MNKFIAIIVAVFALNAFAADAPVPAKRHEIKIKRITLKRIVKYQIHHFATDDDVVLVDTVPTLGRNRYYYAWNRLVKHELSDEIKIRLLLARKRALEAYHTNWS